MSSQRMEAGWKKYYKGGADAVVLEFAYIRE